MATKDEFLGRLRRPSSRSFIRPGSAGGATPVYDSAGYSFELNAAASGSVVRIFSHKVFAEMGASSVVCPPEFAGVFSSLGVKVLDDDDPSAELGVAVADWGIATTGTVVLSGSQARSVSLLPPKVLFIIGADKILATSQDLFGNMKARYPDGPPSSLVLVTGPSRSADIELELTVGVHGPGTVWIAIRKETHDGH